MGQGEGVRLQTLRFESPAGPWSLHLWTPAADLREHVAGLWATEARTVAFRERVLPRQSVELMINFGGPQHLHLHEAAHATRIFRRSWVSGLQTACLEIESPTAAQLIAASLHPAHAGPLLGIAGGELTGRVVALDEVIAREADVLASRLEESPSVAGRFLLFEDFLRSRVRCGRWGAHPAVSRAVSRLLASGGQVAIRAVAEEIGCSPRYLELRVREETGLSPKQLARLIRFSRCVEQVRAAATVDWGRIAHSCGYFDQSHFNRDFRRFAGVSPTGFLAAREGSSQGMILE
ncbi:MAG: helix-turn-helix domain-containing protein [Bryobacteraceae bacterium]|nr:helix-turn-helix domain-containing protein [Bryobacteraceae bacterium]